jgi:transcriptional accessory protein Tex/SPT6
MAGDSGAANMSVAVGGLRPWQVAAVVRLLDDGATVPFITRYRAANTGGLDEDQVRVRWQTQQRFSCRWRAWNSHIATRGIGAARARRG